MLRLFVLLITKFAFDLKENPKNLHFNQTLMNLLMFQVFSREAEALTNKKMIL